MNDIFGAANASDDDAINRIFACGLTIASLLDRPDVGAEIASRLQALVGQLDDTVATLRRAALARALYDRAVHCTTPQGEERGQFDGLSLDSARRRLSRFGGDAFAYALHGHDFYRMSNHELWAHESDGLLLSARSGSPFARRDGRVFYDVETNVPLYYEDKHIGPVPGPGQLS